MHDEYWKTREADSCIRLAIERLAGDYPFHAGILSQFAITPRPSISTMAVACRGQYTICLYFSAQFVLSISHPELRGVLLHELGHVLFDHLSVDISKYPDQSALTIAQECTVNEHVQEPLPGNPLTIDQFGLPAWESTDERYQRLRGRSEQLQDAANNTIDDHTIWSEANLNQAEIEDLIDDVVRQTITELGPDTIPESLLETLAQHNPGLLPGNLEELRLPPLPGTLDWRLLLRRYTGQLLMQRPTYNRPNRRFPELIGIVPGSIRAPSKPHVVCVIDTSGSITSKLLQLIDAELALMARTFTVTVVECDVEIHAVYKYRSIQTVHGRGGTNLCPPFEDGFLRKHRADLIVYWTDGFGPAPQDSPSTPVVWCIVPRGKPPASWGRVIFLEPSDALRHRNCRTFSAK